MKDEGYSSGSMLVSFLLGGIVGAGLALLLAPQSGSSEKNQAWGRTAFEKTSEA